MSSEPDKVIFLKDCIFCNKTGSIRVKVKGSWVHQRTSLFEYGGGTTVLQIAANRQDERLLTRIRDKDLFACEAHFHPSCRKLYTSEAVSGTRPFYIVYNRNITTRDAIGKTYQLASKDPSEMWVYNFEGQSREHFLIQKNSSCHGLRTPVS